jgi:cytochrome c oxidase subunit 3
MSYSTPGPLRHLDRHGRLEASGEVPDGGYAGAGARGVAPSEAPASESEVLGFGMKLFLASLTMIFGATFAAYGIIWWRNRADWQGAVDSGEVIRLAAATVLLVIADVAAARAFRQESDQPRAFRLTRLTLITASIYVVVQSFSWFPLIAQGDPDGDGTLRMEGFLFLMLTVAHAAHVLGGVVANGIVLARSTGGRGPQSGSLQMLYQYWRFLTVMWVAVLALLFGM